LFKAKGLVRAKIGEANGFEDSSVTSFIEFNKTAALPRNGENT
jgi:hypothetical protein